MERSLRYNQIFEIYKIYISIYVLVDDKYDEISWNFFAYHQRRQNPIWPPIMVKKHRSRY